MSTGTKFPARMSVAEFLDWCPEDGRTWQLVDGEPVFVIEILSPGNHRETWANIWACASIPSVREILVVSSIEVGADLLVRRADGSWPDEPRRLAGGDIAFETIGFRSALSAFYRTARLTGAPASPT